MTTLIVAGALANKPGNGGEAWVRLSWFFGLRDFGFDVHLVEQIRDADCFDRNGAPTPFRQSANVAFFRSVTEYYGIANHSTLIHVETHDTVGLPWEVLLDLATEAALLVNISGHLTLPPLWECIRRAAYIDIDPGFTQFWSVARADVHAHLARHDTHFTIGENIGAAGCPIPTAGFTWRPMRQPVVLAHWPVATPSNAPRHFTTVANWRGPYGPVDHAGVTYGLKAHEWRKFITLPTRIPQPVTFAAALAIHAADSRDQAALLRNGWQLVDPTVVAGNPWSFRQYVHDSDAEFSNAQGMYVQTGSGWMSDRTLRYLASGKPALVQDTGFGTHYPVGMGLVPFRTLDDAVAGVTAILDDYPLHCRSARSIAETYFAAPIVLGPFLDVMGVTPPHRNI